MSPSVIRPLGLGVASLLLLSIVTASCITNRAAQAASESERLNAFFERVHQEAVARWPEWQSYLGIKDNQDKWNDISDARAVAEQEITRRNLETLETQFDFEQLDVDAKLSYRLFAYGARQRIAGFPFRHHYYVVSHLSGKHKGIPSLLIETHGVDDLADAEAYIARLEAVAPLMDDLIELIELRASKGTIPPKFVFPKVLDDCRKILSGAPFDSSGTDSPLLADIRKKFAALDADEIERARLLEAAERALLTRVKPAYEKFMAAWESLATRATGDDGVWHLPDGAGFYALRLRQKTTTTLSPDEIHAYGLGEVARIQDEMRGLMGPLGFTGSLGDFFAFMREDPGNFLPDSEAGRAAYLEQTRILLDEAWARLDQVFITKPKGKVVVRRIEPFRERTSAQAFYQSPSLTGDRPGVYYVNLSDMGQMPRSHMAALAYHEAIPGHHLQIALAQELAGIPTFRRLSGYTAYSEGWALYAENLAKDMGLYRDAAADFGRLAWELLRAVRLVADTGLHAKRWSRRQAIDYLNANLPQSEAENAKAVERYLVWPAQATAYKIGMRRILELRARAKRRLAGRFDIRDFHQVVLGNGSVPLTVLEDLVEAWIEQAGG